MSDGAKVDDLDVFRVVKAAMLKFRSAADAALVNADAQISHTKSWLEGEQLAYWQTQIRKRTEAVSRAKEAVRQKQLFKDSTGRTPSAFQEEKVLRAAIAALEHAEARLVNTKKAVPALEKEIEAYRSGVQGLGSMLTAEFPKAVAALERMAATLDEYITLSSRVSGGDGGAGSALPTEAAVGNMDRGGESASEATPAPAPESSSASPAEEGKGAGHVDG